VNCMRRIWAEPVPKLAARLGCSDTWLRTICKKLSVPQPPRGFWARVHGRQPVQRLPLPPGDDVDIGLRIQPEASATPRSKGTSGDELKQTLQVLVEREVHQAALDLTLAARSLEPPNQLSSRDQVPAMRQLYKDAKAWRRHRDTHAFLNELASNVVYRDGSDRATLLRWLERMRANLDATNPVRVCIERVVALEFQASRAADTAGGRPQV
jgi:hypothetical protein